MADKTKTDPFGRVLELRPDMVQSHVAAWARAYVQMPRVGLPEQYQAALQAAIVAEWIVAPEVKATQEVDMATGAQRTVYVFDGVEVSQMPANEVIFYGRMMDQHYGRLTTVPDPKK